MTDAVIVDLDGTLCDTSQISHLVDGDNKDFVAFHQASADAPMNGEVAREVENARKSGAAVMVLTSREFVWRDLTLDWLAKHNFQFDQLVMRIVGDYRPDYTIKNEMLVALENDGYTVTEAWEDSAKVIEHWREHGIVVHDVGSDQGA